MNLNIYTSYHNNDYVEEYKLNEHNTKNKILYNTIGENPLININDKNKLFGEFVTMYYVYFNDIKCDYIGFEHYRRRFKDIDMDDIQNYLDSGHIIVGDVIHDICPRKNFIDSHKHKNKFDFIIKLLNKKYGIKNKYSNYLCNESGVDFYACELFIMDYDKFRQMFEFIWDLIVQLDNKIDGKEFNLERYKKILNCKEQIEYNFRFYGFLIERLVSCWIYCNGDNNIIEIRHECP